MGQTVLREEGMVNAGFSSPPTAEEPTRSGCHLEGAAFVGLGKRLDSVLLHITGFPG